MSYQTLHLLNHRLWCHLENKLKLYFEQANRQNFHALNSHRQHAGGLFQTMPYDRLFLSNSWASCFVLCVIYSDRGRQNSVASVIMMYSPDIPSSSRGKMTSSVDAQGTLRRASGAEFVAYENYYARIETEESVKCVVSSILFFLVLLAFFLVALLINPEM